MNIGISSSCFYPEYTEKGFRKIAELGIKTTEIFFNSKSELYGEIFNEIMAIKNHYGINIISMHPFASFAEGYFLYGEYERLFYDSLEDYKKIFEYEAKFGAKYHVMHGCKTGIKLCPEFYAERYDIIRRAAQEAGIILTHENVVNFHCGNPDFIKAVSDLVGDNFKMTLDIKQARRAGVDYNRFIDLLGEKIVHLHLSDYTDTEDCIIPGERGKFDFKALSERMKKLNYNGAALIEVYSQSFGDKEELKAGYEYLINKIS